MHLWYKLAHNVASLTKSSSSDWLLKSLQTRIGRFVSSGQKALRPLCLMTHASHAAAETIGK